MREVLKLIKKYKWYAIFTPILVILELVTSIVIPIILSNLIDNGINKGDFEYIKYSGLLIILLAIISLIFAIISIRIGTKAAHGFGGEIRKKMWEKINNFSFANIDQFSTPTLITRLTNDTERISQATMMTLRMAIRAPLMLIISSVITFKINSELALIILSAVPVIILIAGILAKFVRPIFMQIQKRVDDINRVVQENIKGIRVIKTYTLEDEENKKFNQKNIALKDILIKVVIIMNLLEPLFSLIVSGAGILVLYLGGKLVIKGNMLQGDLVAFITYSMQILVAFLMLAGYFVFIISSSASFTRIKEVILSKPNIKEKENPKKDFNNFNIEFKDVWFAYDKRKLEEENPIKKILEDDTLSKKEKKEKIKEAKILLKEKKKEEKRKKKNNKNINKNEDLKDKEIEKTDEINEENIKYTLKNINFKIEEGKSLGIIGPTGSGKTTIANLLLRFYDVNKGSVLIGNTDVKDYALNSINKNISLIQQKSTLLKGTIKDNLLMSKPNATDKEIIDMLKVSQSYNFVSEYDDFLDHEVLTNGQNFSGGQKQRLTIARALLKDFNILVIDDATSALDYNTERRLQEEINNINKVKNRDEDNKITKIIISQRISSVKNCNNILVLENGEISAQGKHEELINTSKLYNEIFEEQGGKYAEQ